VERASNVPPRAGAQELSGDKIKLSGTQDGEAEEGTGSVKRKAELQNEMTIFQGAAPQ